VVTSLRGQVPPGVDLVLTGGEPTRLIEAWTGAALAVVVDAVRADPPRPGRVHRFVLDRPMAGPARTASSHGFGLDDAVRLALALDRMPVPAEPLTARELTVLRLLRGTFTRREIAQELCVSANTIKSHVRAVYQKLVVSSRRDAIQRGRELGIL
jgi:DNA-binding CsgD family transcriptional regulator